jgi:hypothetical protein
MKKKKSRYIRSLGIGLLLYFLINLLLEIVILEGRFYRPMTSLYSFLVLFAFFGLFLSYHLSKHRFWALVILTMILLAEVSLKFIYSVDPFYIPRLWISTKLSFWALFFTVLGLKHLKPKHAKINKKIKEDKVLFVPIIIYFIISFGANIIQSKIAFGWDHDVVINYIAFTLYIVVSFFFILKAWKGLLWALNIITFFLILEIFGRTMYTVLTKTFFISNAVLIVFAISIIALRIYKVKYSLSKIYNM